MDLKKYLPILEVFPGYKKVDFKFDFISGLTVGIMLVPQGMAYALLAGMPPIYGLYSGLIPIFLYGLFGTSRQLSIGPVAISSLLVLAGISKLAEPQSESFIALVILAGLLIGIVQIGMSFLKLGFLVNFLSHPVVAGFTSAAAVIIAISQLKYILGIDIPRFGHFYQTLEYAAFHLQETNLPTLMIGVAGILIILLFRKISRKIPGALMVLAIGILVVKIFGLDRFGVDIVGNVPKGLPGFSFPDFNLENVKAVLPTVFVVTIIEIVESIGIAKVLEAKHQNYIVRPNQELLALGISKFGGAFFQSIPTSGSFTRSAINSDSGAKSGLSSIITAVLVGLTLVLLTPVFFYLPKTILAAIIMVAIAGLFAFKEALFLWKVYRSDFYMLLLTFVVTLVLGIGQGVLAGVLLSLILVIYRSSTPHMVVLGKLPETTYYRNISRFPKALQRDDALIVRFDAPLYFCNASFFKESIRNFIKQKGDKLKLLLLDASSIQDIDASGLDALKEMIDQSKNQNITFYISGVIGPVRDLLFKAGLMEGIGSKNQFMHVHDAMEFYKNQENDKASTWSKDVLQTNAKKTKSP